jgi:hypothetical protein
MSISNTKDALRQSLLLSITATVEEDISKYLELAEYFADHLTDGEIEEVHAGIESLMMSIP